jgi:hypothetical protein
VRALAGDSTMTSDFPLFLALIELLDLLGVESTVDVFFLPIDNSLL